MLSNLYADTRSSVLFLSRLPMSHSTHAVPQFDRSATTFALAGLIIGLPSAAIVVLGSFLQMPVWVVVIIAVAAMVLVTGALHEDGLADTADGFWGGFDVQRRLEIMRDSHIGTYGVLTLILCLALRLTLYVEVYTAFNGIACAAIMLSAASVSRAAML